MDIVNEKTPLLQHKDRTAGQEYPANLPTHPAGPPSHPGCLPSHPGSLPTHPGSLPSHPAGPPSHPGSLPTHPGSLPSHPAGPPTHPPGQPSHPASLSIPPVSLGSSPMTDVTADSGGISSPANDELIPASCTSHSQSIQAGKALRVYRTRWYILTVFSCLGCMQGGMVDSWPVIAESAEAAFGWTDKDLSLLQAWMYITYVLAIVPFTWLIDHKGMRVAMVTCTLVNFAGALCRCIFKNPPMVTWMAHVGNILVGFAGPVVFTAGPVLSGIWFPPHERVTATAVMTIAGFAGPTWGYLLGPLLVQQPKYVPEEGSFENTTAIVINIAVIRQDIFYLRLIEAALCAIVTVAILVYFPSKPKLPPSFSASQPRVSFLSGARALFTPSNRGFWLIVAVYALSAGLFDAWGGLLDVYLKPRVSEFQAGWLASAGDFFGSVAAIIVGRMADVFGHMKEMAVVIVAGCVVSTFWFLLQANNLITYSNIQLSIATILQGIFMNAPVPLFYELALEANYPIDETVTSGVMSLVYNMFPLVFLAIFWLPNIGIRWTAWFMYGCLLISFPLLLCFREKFRRLAVDQEEPSLYSEASES